MSNRDKLLVCSVGEKQFGKSTICVDASTQSPLLQFFESSFLSGNDKRNDVSVETPSSGVRYAEALPVSRNPQAS